MFHSNSPYRPRVSEPGATNRATVPDVANVTCSTWRSERKTALTSPLPAGYDITVSFALTRRCIVSLTRPLVAVHQVVVSGWGGAGSDVGWFGSCNGCAHPHYSYQTTHLSRLQLSQLRPLRYGARWLTQ